MSLKLTTLQDYFHHLDVASFDLLQPEVPAYDMIVRSQPIVINFIVVQLLEAEWPLIQVLFTIMKIQLYVLCCLLGSRALTIGQVVVAVVTGSTYVPLATTLYLMTPLEW